MTDDTRQQARKAERELAKEMAKADKGRVKSTQLLDLMKNLMRSVDIDNVAVQADPGQAALEMASLLGEKFETVDIRAACDTLMMDPEAVWPTPGHMVNLCLAENGKRRPTKKGPLPFSNVDGWGYDQIMKSQEGLAAMRRGKPHTFLMDVKNGRISVDDLTFQAGTSRRS